MKNFASLRSGVRKLRNAGVLIFNIVFVLNKYVTNPQRKLNKNSQDKAASFLFLLSNLPISSSSAF